MYFVMSFPFISIISYPKFFLLFFTAIWMQEPKKEKQSLSLITLSSKLFTNSEKLLGKKHYKS